MSVETIKKTLAGLMGAAIALMAGNASAELALNLPRTVTPIGQQIYDLHMIVLWIVTVIGIVVFGVMFYSIINHRKSKGVKPAQFHESTTVEVVWTIIPFLILVAVAIPATRTLVAMEDANTGAEMTVKITAFQWKWKYDYMDEGIGFYSTLSTPREEVDNVKPKDQHYLLEVDHPLVVPVNKKIRFLLTSNDVAHAWWVPDLGVKKDAYPGFINETWAKIEKPGTYRGQCAELCGRDHGFMPIVVVAKTEDDYQKWVQEQKAAKGAPAAPAQPAQPAAAQPAAPTAVAAATPAEEKPAAAETAKPLSHDDLMAQGETVYKSHCAACHQANGEGMPPAFPALKGSKIATGPLADHLDRVLHGKQGTAMVAFGPQLSDTELAAVVTYERNAFGNDTGDTVQPSQVKAAR